MTKQNKILLGLALVGIIVIVAYAAKTLSGYREAVQPSDAINTQSPIPTARPTDYVRGNANATKTVIEFGDMECPYCATSDALMKQLTERYPDVRVVWKDCPLPQHTEARAAAVAARCAGRQGKYWEFHDTLLASQDKLRREYYLSLAQGLKLDLAKYQTCLDNGQEAATVQSSFEECAAAGVTELPWIFANGQTFSGANAAFGLINGPTIK